VIHKILKETFGYAQFRPLQEDAIQSSLKKKDTLLVLPTGGGKSICYQIPALAQSGIALIISPLIALMNDQVMSLRANGIEAYALHSNIDYDEKNSIINKIDNNRVKLIYISPEGIINQKTSSYLKTLDINIVAVDEAHCVSMWGNDFRPDYTKLSCLKELFPKAPIMAVTATADQVTQKDIVDKLKLNSPDIYIGSFERENIHIRALPGIGRYNKILRFVNERRQQAGIIYCTSRKQTETVSGKLKADGFRSAHYHAGLDRSQREEVHQDFIHDRIQIVCATIAFGMGIDKSNIEFIIHYNLSKNIESYYQEIGRAGRDGSSSEALLFYSYADITQLKRFIDDGEASETFKTVQHAKLDRMWAFANTNHCRTNIILNYFGEYKNTECGHCDNCQNPPITFDGTTYAQMALSAISRAREQLNINLLIDILRGSGKKEILDNGYQHIKTYGVGRDLPFSDWRSYITQMIQQGLISIDYSDKAKMKLTPLSKSVLFENLKVKLVKFEWEDNSKSVRNRKPVLSVVNVDEDLFEALRSVRSKLAKQEGVPAYVIFPNKTLEALSSEKPTDKISFSLINGVGKMKLEKYSEVFIKAIEKYKAAK